MISAGGALAAAVAVFLIGGMAAHAQELPAGVKSLPRVALLSTTAEDPLAGRLEAEMRSVGIDVSRTSLSPLLDIDEQARSELGSGARAVVVADGHRTHVWIAEDDSDRVGLRQELEVAQASGQEAVLALRTVEFLRISLGLVSAPPSAPPPPPVVAPAPPPATIATSPPDGVGGPLSLALDVSSGALASSGGFGASAVIGIAFRARLVDVVGAELCAYLPLGESDLTTAFGSTHSSVWLVGGGVTVLPHSDRRFAVEASLGALAAIARSTGVADPSEADARVRTDQRTGLAIYGRVAARVRLAPRWSLRVDALIGTAAVRPVINVPAASSEDQQVASWGAVFGGGVAGVELIF
ncbi:MAG TPA: hypothetical protein VHG72_03220 [Polyangia bacterium]|nr:hypothetical protein [Polyangia bacterium]